MRVRRMAVVALWIMSLVMASQWGSARAQSEQEPPAKAPGQAPPQVVSGADLGFMVLPGTGEQGTPAGVIVIRQRGQWVPVEISRPVSPGDSRGRVVPLR
jgi:hypothetical protein